MKRSWILSPRPENASKVAGELKIHPAIASVLLRRDFKNSSEIFTFLNPSLEALEDPFKFSHMQKAVDRIRQAIAKKEKILIYGDYDVDGITGSAILFPVLKKLGADVEVHIPHRIEDGYGLNQASLEKLLKKKFTLIITVDNGITGVKEIQFLRDKGIDAIIVDHHTPKEALPPAFAIVSSCVDGMGDPNLAACGVAFKLAWALLGSFEEAKEHLDLVAVGTVCDMAPVLGDNRILLKHGLNAILKTKKVGLRALMDTARMSKNYITHRDIAFGVGPRINASGRMGSPENSFLILTTENALMAQNLAQLLEEGNRDRQRAEADAFEEALLRVEEDFVYAKEKILVVDSPSWHEGIIGIVAARLVERYSKPAVVIASRQEAAKGSGRSLPSVSLFDVVACCEDLLSSFGGHAQACGLTIERNKIPLFRKRLNEAALLNASLNAAPAFTVDAEMLLNEIDLKFLNDLEQLAPFGPGNKKPLFLSKGLRLKGTPKKRGKDTLQCWMTDEVGQVTCEAIGFRAYDRWSSNPPRGIFDAVYQPSLKEFNGIRSIELSLEDWE